MTLKSIYDFKFPLKYAHFPEIQIYVKIYTLFINNKKKTSKIYQK